MRKFIATKFIAIALMGLVTGLSIGAEETPGLPKPTKEHEWLKQFEGKWETISKVTPGPGMDPVECEGKIESKMLGGFWVVSDFQSDMAGEPMHAIQTIGYDAEKKLYIGTWVDSMTNHLWKYEGSVDKTGKILTLQADGPSFTKPGEKSPYRDIYEFVNKDEVKFSSQIQGEDGKWITFTTGITKRVK